MIFEEIFFISRFIFNLKWGKNLVTVITSWPWNYFFNFGDILYEMHYSFLFTVIQLNYNYSHTALNSNYLSLQTSLLVLSLYTPSRDPGYRMNIDGPTDLQQQNVATETGQRFSCLVYECSEIRLMYRLTCSKTLVCNKLSISLLYPGLSEWFQNLRSQPLCQATRWNNGQIIESNFSIQDVDECLLCSDLLWTLRKSFLIYGSTGHFS